MYFVNGHTRHTIFAINLDGYILVVGSSAYECTQINCLEETHLEAIVPPLTPTYVGNGCEGYTTYIYIHL